MADQLLTPTRDNDVAILEGVLRGVQEQGARYGLSQARRQVLALALETVLLSMQRQAEVLLAGLLRDFQQEVGRPPQPETGARGDHHLSDSTPRLTS